MRTIESPEQQRKSALSFAIEAYGKMGNNRLYATDEQNQIALAALARAMFLRRIQQGRSSPDDKPSSWEEFFGIIQKLSDAGANILQKRPGDPKPLPKPWLDPSTWSSVAESVREGFRGLQAQDILARRDPDLAAHYKAVASDPYGTLAKYQDAEAARSTLQAIQYGETEHSVNPFRNANDVSGQSVFIKNAPPGMVEFCKSEAQDVSIPLFAKEPKPHCREQARKRP